MRYEKHKATGRGSGERRIGAGKKRLKGDFGSPEIAVPRDLASNFKPQLLPKGQTRWLGFDDKILSLYACSMHDARHPGPLGRDIQGRGVGGGDLERDRAVMDEVRAWQSRPRDEVYAIIDLDALVVKMRVENR